MSFDSVFLKVCTPPLEPIETDKLETLSNRTGRNDSDGTSLRGLGRDRLSRSTCLAGYATSRRQLPAKIQNMASFCKTRDELLLVYDEKTMDDAG